MPNVDVGEVSGGRKITRFERINAMSTVLVARKERQRERISPSCGVEDLWQSRP